MSTPTVPAVRIAEPTPSGLASVLGDLIAQNLARDPGRARHAVPAMSAIEARDAGVAVTIDVTPSAITLTDGVNPAATVLVRASSDRLLSLVSAPLRLGFPDVLRAEGRAVVADLLHRRIEVRGLVRHPRQVVRLTLLLSVRETAP